MRIKRFGQINESKKESTKKCETLAYKELEKELKKQAMSRYEMIKFLEDIKKIKDGCETSNILKNVVRTTVDNIIVEDRINSTNIKDKENGYSKAYFWIGDDVDISVFKSYMTKIDKSEENKKGKKTNESMFISFDSFIKS